MGAPKLLPKPAVALAYGEPWRAPAGTLVSDEPGVRRSDRLADRAYYGGTLVAESGDRRLMQRAADCVNFCAGVEFKPGFAYVGGLTDLLDALQVLHERMPEPELPLMAFSSPAERTAARSYYELYSDVNQLLEQFGRGRLTRRRGS